MPQRLRCVFKCEQFDVLHRFPKPEHASLERFQQWKEIVGQHLQGIDDNYIHTNYRICNHHFEDHFFYPQSKRLAKTAYPALNLRPLHSFPSPVYSHEDRFNMWKSVLSEDIRNKGNSYIHGNIRLCGRHFEHKYHTCGKRLTANSVPTLNLSLTSSSRNKTGQDMAVHETETLTSTTDNEPKTDRTADAKSRLENIPGKADGLGVHVSGIGKTTTSARSCETLTKNESSPDSKNPLAMAECSQGISLAKEGDKESNIDDADLLNISDLEIEYLEDFSEVPDNEFESTAIEESLKEADDALIDKASNTEGTTNVIKDANLLIYDADNLPIKNIICATCFSSGRTLYPLVQRKYFSMVQQFCSDVQFTKEDMICWECDALINKIRKFKHQVVLAQSRFREFITQGDKVIITKTLSSMKTTKVTHISISSGSTSEVVTRMEDELDILDNDRDGEYREVSHTSPFHIHQPTDRCGDDDIKKVTNDKEREKSNERKVVRTYYNKPKQKYNVIHIPKIKQKAKLLPQPDSLKEVCMKKVMTEEEMEKFRSNMRSKWTSGEHSCHKCIISFQFVEQLNEHNKKHDPKAGNFACRVCDQRFLDVAPRDAHYHSHFVLFECASCGLLTRGRNAMLGHFERLHRERRRVCRDCGEVFLLFKDFRQHRLVAHGPKMTCEHCGKIFRERKFFSKHLRLHKNQSLFKNKCHVCGVVFPWQRVLRKHLLDAHDIKTKEDYCAVCDKHFKTWRSYQSHLSTLKHMKLANAPMENVKRQCEDCGRFFTNVVQLRVHRKAYHLYEKCVCDLCNKEFISKALLVQHLKNSTLHKTDRVRNQMCEHCGKSFYEISTLKAHLYTHNTERRFACDVCGSAFTNPLSRYKHRRRVHNLGKGHWKKRSSSHAQIREET